MTISIRQYLLIFAFGWLSILGVYAQDTTPKNEDQAYIMVEQMPEYPGGQAVMAKYIAENLKYPNEAREKGIEGMVVVRFIVTENGKLKDISVVKGLDGGCSDAAIAVVKNMQDWKPGKQKGNNVAVQINLPIRFRLNENDQPKTDAVAEFPGGEESMKEFIRNNVKYPLKEKSNRIEGTTVIEFNVDVAGNIGHPKVLNSLGKNFDKEAIRLFNLLPKKWKPAIKNGKEIESTFILPIEFKLN